MFLPFSHPCVAALAALLGFALWVFLMIWSTLLLLRAMEIEHAAPSPSVSRESREYAAERLACSMQNPPWLIFLSPGRMDLPRLSPEKAGMVEPVLRRALERYICGALFCFWGDLAFSMLIRGDSMMFFFSITLGLGSLLQLFVGVQAWRYVAIQYRRLCASAS